jgi:hypothetical protein
VLLKINVFLNVMQCRPVNSDVYKNRNTLILKANPSTKSGLRDVRAGISAKESTASFMEPVP